MQREILFKGKMEGDTEWIYGSLITPDISESKPKIITQWCEEYEVSDASVCEFTGYEDSENVKIFENDILDSVNGQIEKAQVVFHDGSFWLHFMNEFGENHDEISRSNNDEILHWPANRIAFKIIGNTYDNPELLRD